jgi:hypothetical protein
VWKGFISNLSLACYEDDNDYMEKEDTQIESISPSPTRHSHGIKA